MGKRFKIEFELIAIKPDGTLQVSFDCGDERPIDAYLKRYLEEIVPEYITGEWYWVKLEETDTEFRPARYLDLRNGFYLDGRFYKKEDLFEVSEMCMRPLNDD